MHQEIMPVSLKIRDRTGRKRLLGWACNPGLEARYENSHQFLTVGQADRSRWERDS